MAQVDLIATIPVGDQRDEVLALLRDYAQYVCVEPGMQRFEVYADDVAQAIVIIERYESPEAFEAHLAHPANADFNAKLREVLNGGGSSLQMLRPLV